MSNKNLYDAIFTQFTSKAKEIPLLNQCSRSLEVVFSKIHAPSFFRFRVSKANFMDERQDKTGFVNTARCIALETCLVTFWHSQGTSFIDKFNIRNEKFLIPTRRRYHRHICTLHSNNFQSNPQKCFSSKKKRKTHSLRTEKQDTLIRGNPLSQLHLFGQRHRQPLRIPKKNTLSQKRILTKHAQTKKNQFSITKPEASKGESILITFKSETRESISPKKIAKERRKKSLINREGWDGLFLSSVNRQESADSPETAGTIDGRAKWHAPVEGKKMRVFLSFILLLRR
ncbi:hypothetical protein NPIL_212931 [Nephila pilipes]|uniref:Uncharacterized protein n=1 Tax=Nephila pilipes TaxID=299642 RepID=A0A8X6QN51_NEPPI|nr:hypothetical protein NPIL_212931 [Nephila pilipes]